MYVGALDAGDGVVQRLPPEVQEMTRESVGAARMIAGELGPVAEPYLAQVNDAFISGFSVGSFVAAVVATAGAVFASRFLPSRASSEE